MKIIHIDYGTGNRVGNKIYLNKNLKKYPKLYSAVLDHEQKHTGSFKMQDIKLDLVNKEIKEYHFDWIKFLFNNPKALVNFVPILKLGGQWTIDISILIVWTILSLVFILAWILL